MIWHVSMFVKFPVSSTIKSGYYSCIRNNLFVFRTKQRASILLLTLRSDLNTLIPLKIPGISLQCQRSLVMKQRRSDNMLLILLIICLHHSLARRERSTRRRNNKCCRCCDKLTSQVWLFSVDLTNQGVICSSSSRPEERPKEIAIIKCFLHFRVHAQSSRIKREQEMKSRGITRSKQTPMCNYQSSVIIVVISCRRLRSILIEREYLIKFSFRNLASNSVLLIPVFINLRNVLKLI